MDVYLVKRYDLIPNLVETIKGYANHEHETLAEVIKFRNMNTNTTEERLENENNISSAISRLMVVIENYPELKANTNFLSLQSELKSIEEEIEKARKYYNGYVRNYNEMIVVVPTCIVANMLGFKKEPFFETTPESRENVKVEF
jgi:LemA protein